MRLLHLICNLDKYGCLSLFCSLHSSQCTVVHGTLLKVQDHWSEVCKRLVRSYFQWHFNNFYEFHCIVWKLFEQVWHWALNLNPCWIVLMQGLIYATFSLWHLCPYWNSASTRRTFWRYLLHFCLLSAW